MNRVAAALAHTTKPKEHKTMTREQAEARRAALAKDNAWVARFMAGEAAARQEAKALDYEIAGIPAPAPTIGRPASQIRDELISDPAWAAKYMAGDVSCREQLATLHAKIAEAEE